MPLYEFACSAGHTSELILKYEDLADLTLTCVECKEEMKQQFNMHNKPLVVDRDLAQARNHNGKKY
jgi:putative FmdB family regulatory protein